MHDQGSNQEYIFTLTKLFTLLLIKASPPLFFYFPMSLEITLRIQREPGTIFPEALKADSPEGRAQTGDLLAVGPSQVT